MRLFDLLFTRRREQPRFADLSSPVRRRLVPACCELTDAEAAIAHACGLSEPPRLLMVDEEKAVVLTPADRVELMR